MAMDVAGRNDVIKVKAYESPCGRLLLGSFDGMLCLCEWQGGKSCARVDARLRRMLGATFEEGTSETIEKAQSQLDGFFAGTRKSFDVPLAFVSTGFQKTVWNGLLKIPFGTTVTYAALAKRIGMPTACRAVANANGANAMSIFVPCHRVVGSNGNVGGYGGGVVAKKMLLDLEAKANNGGALPLFGRRSADA